MFRRRIRNRSGARQDPDSGAGRRGGRAASSGPGGNCVCPKCGHKVPHQAGIPCRDVACPKCSTKMIREGTTQ